MIQQSGHAMRQRNNTAYISEKWKYERIKAAYFREIDIP